MPPPITPISRDLQPDCEGILKLVQQNEAIFDPVGNFELSDKVSNYLLTRNHVLAK
jgi:hypothetical protein